MSGFQKFILRGNVVDLAVGVVIGAAFAAVVTAFVTDLLTPFIGIFGGVPDFSAMTFTINNSQFMIGHFINALLSFLLVALIIYYFVVVPVNRLMDRMKGETPIAPTTRECPECLSKIPRAARRCAFCATEVTPEVMPDRVVA
ncbi:MAG: large conductance mechanosensitive channel protein MscL [Chloroflexota bacterium]